MTLSALLIIIGRFLLGAYFAQAGVRNFMKLPLHTSLLEKKGIPRPRESLLVALTVQTLGGLMVALGVLPATGAVGLILFTIVANIVHHDFWSFTGAERQPHISAWTANSAIVGGLLLVVAISGF